MTETKVTHPKETPFVVVPIQVRLSDTDMFRHINNVSYLAFTESVRMEFFVRHGVDLTKELCINRAVTIDYQRPATFLDSLVGLVRITRMGSSSIDLEVRIANADDHSVVYATCHIVQINVCAKTGQPTPVSDELRAGLRVGGQID